MKITLLESLFNKELNATLLKKAPTQVFFVNIVQFSKSPVLKNLCERIFLSDVISARLI